MTWCRFLWGGTRLKMSNRGKSEVNAVLEVIIGSGDEALELNGTGDEGARLRWFGGLAKGVGIYNALDVINGGCEEFCMVFDC